VIIVARPGQPLGLPQQPIEAAQRRDQPQLRTYSHPPHLAGWGWSRRPSIGTMEQPVSTPDKGSGRVQEARPRDALGRPLPRGAIGVEPVSELALPPEQALELAGRLVEEGRPFSAHEVLEAVWKAGPPQERQLWQGLAQLCVALTHHARGNEVGGQRLLERGTGLLESYAQTVGPKYGLDLPAIIACTTTRIAP
jgi:hypothetical protein